MVVEVLIGGDGSGQTWHKCCGTTDGSTQHTHHTSALTAFVVFVVGHNLDEPASLMCHDSRSGMQQRRETPLGSLEPHALSLVHTNMMLTWAACQHR